MSRTAVGPGLATSTPLFPLPASTLSLPPKAATIQFGPITALPGIVSGGVRSPTRVSGTSFGPITSSSGLTSPRISGSTSPTRPTQSLFETSGRSPSLSNVSRRTFVPTALPSPVGSGLATTNSIIPTGTFSPVEGYYNIPTTTPTGQLPMSFPAGVTVTTPPVAVRSGITSPTRRMTSPTTTRQFTTSPTTTRPIVLPVGLTGVASSTQSRSLISPRSLSSTLPRTNENARTWRHNHLSWFKPVQSDRADFTHMVRVYDPVNKIDMLVYFGDPKVSRTISPSRRQTVMNSGYERTTPGTMTKDDPLTALFWERRFLHNSGESYEVFLPEGLSQAQLPPNFTIKSIFYA